jgi:hypothetical protein
MEFSMAVDIRIKDFIPQSFLKTICMVCIKFKKLVSLYKCSFHRGEEFKTAFKKLSGIKACFPDIPLIGLSGTLTLEQKRTIPKQLGLVNYKLIEETPDKPNIFLEKHKKTSDKDAMSEYETIVHEICDKPYEQKNEFPVTLLFIPVYYMSEVLMYLNGLFQASNINEAVYSTICSGQDDYVINTTIEELKKENPRIRLVLTTSIAGM